MPNKLTPRNESKHSKNHKEFFEPKIEMVVCGCGNRRLLTIDEQMKYKIIPTNIETNYELSLYNLASIPPNRRNSK